jgi:hypothetical protein
MREAVGGLGLTQIVIFFLVLFSGYLCVSINTNKAYKVKDEIITILQKNNGFDETSLEQIQDYMTSVGYRSTGTCGVEDGDGYSSTGNVTLNNKALFCVRTMDVKYETTNGTSPQFPETAYYRVKVFFSLDVPVLGNAFGFSLTGTTKKLFYPKTME